MHAHQNSMSAFPVIEYCFPCVSYPGGSLSHKCEVCCQLPGRTGWQKGGVMAITITDAVEKNNNLTPAIVSGLIFVIPLPSIQLLPKVMMNKTGHTMPDHRKLHFQVTLVERSTYNGNSLLLSSLYRCQSCTQIKIAIIIIRNLL